MNISQKPVDQLPPINFEDPAARLQSVEETEDEALAAVMTSLGDDSGASVRIYRQGPGGYRDVTFLTEWLPTEYSLTRLQGEYGGGTYRIHVRQGGQLLANGGVKLEARKDQQPAQRAPDTGLAQVQQQIAALAGIVEKLAAPRDPAPQQSRMDWLKELQVMRELFAAGQPAPRQSDPIEMLMKMLTLQKELGGIVNAAGGDAEPGTMTVLMKAMETFAPVIQNAAAGRAAAPLAGYQQNPMEPVEGFQEQDMAPAPALPAAAPAETNQQTNQEADMLKMYIRMLINEAAQGIDPEAWAMLIVQKVARDQVEAMLKPDNWFDTLSQFEPAVAPHREWFSDLRDIVFEILNEQGAADTTDANQSGGTNHASGGAANANT